MARRSTAKVRIKQMPCSECGTMMDVGSNKRKSPRHVDCGIAKAADVARQMKEHSGPAWDKYLQSQREWASKLLGGTPLP